MKQRNDKPENIKLVIFKKVEMSERKPGRAGQEDRGKT